MGAERVHPAAVRTSLTDAGRGAQGPIRIVEHDSHGWEICARGDDRLLLDEYGDLWWAQVSRAGEARIIRPCWPEERRRFQARIARARSL